MPKKPNLFLIGAAKSGTTSLHHLLSTHPAIFLSEPKEPGFFVPELTYYPADADWYMSLFAAAGNAVYRGESSTHYTKLPLYRGVAARIAAFVDEPPRFIYLMRDPVDRTLSHYWHNVRKHQEHRPLEAAFREVPEYTAVSDYPMQLAPYFEEFGRDAVFAATFEELVAEPDRTVRSLLSWLGLDPALPRGGLEKRNARPERFTRLRGRGRLDRFARSRLWDRLSPGVPQWIKALGRRAGYRPAAPDEEAMERAVEQLRPEMRAMAERLGVLLGRSFQDWTTTFSAEPARTGPDD